MRRKIEDRLLELGIKPNLNGFGYICDFIELIIDDEERKFKMMYLYSFVAKKNKTTSTSVERAIRHAISKINFSASSRDSSIGLRSYPDETISEPALIKERLIAFS